MTAQSPTTTKILCVDDEAIIRELCRSALEDYQVLLAANGRQALEILTTEPIDLVLSDIMMPDIGGLDLLQKIKEQKPDQAVVLMTGYSNPETILTALKSGADDFIEKPINIVQLDTTVKKVLEKQQIRLELRDLKHVDQLKTDFLGLISHKLKTPATAISLFIQNLAEGVEDPSSAGFQQVLAMVQAETQHLEKLIQDLLYFSEATLEKSEQELEPLDLALVADQVAASLRPAAARAHLDLQLYIEPPMATRPLQLNSQRIIFALFALLDNAIKFTPAGGSIKVTGNVTDDRVALTIEDTGIGIPQQEIGKIFSKFYQVDPERTGQVRGFGLGLYYAREFIQNMDGRLTIASVPEQGTVCRIEFPLPR